MPINPYQPRGNNAFADLVGVALGGYLAGKELGVFGGDKKAKPSPAPAPTSQAAGLKEPTEMRRPSAAPKPPSPPTRALDLSGNEAPPPALKPGMTPGPISVPVSQQPSKKPTGIDLNQQAPEPSPSSPMTRRLEKMGAPEQSGQFVKAPQQDPAALIDQGLSELADPAIPGPVKQAIEPILRAAQRRNKKAISG